MRARLHVSANAGVFMPITAAIATVLVTVVFALGFDAGLQKLAAVRIRALAESTCRAAARELPITKSAVDIAHRALVDGLPKVKGADVKFVNIVAPTSPLSIGQAPFVTARQTLACPGAVCYFYGTVTDSRITDFFPTNFWSNNNFGDIIACGIEAQTISMMSGTRTVRQTVAWEVRQIGAIQPTDSYTPVHRIPNPRGFIGGGAIVVVDPTMTTNTTSAYQKFPMPDIELGVYNPLRKSGLLPLTHFSGNRPSYTASLQMNELLSEPLRTERAHACFPLAVALRNKFLVGLVARFRGRLRDMTAVYVANPMHRAVRAAGKYDYYPSEPNPPSLVVQGSRDIMASAYRLPYVIYSPGFEDGDELNPFVTNPDSDAARKDRMNVGQLADCYHMYGGGSVTPGGMDRVVEESASNTGYESLEIEATSKLAQLAPAYEPSFGTYPWDQEIGLPEPTQHPLRSVEQVLSMLGTVQICPQGENGGDLKLGPGCDEGGTKPPTQLDPTLPTNDLRGDLRGALMAVNGARTLSDGTVVPFYSYNATDLPGAKPTEEVFTRSATLVVVLHRRLGLDEVAEIREQVNIFNAGPPSGRRILVAYFPATPQDLAAAAVSRIKSAFNIPDNPYPNTDENLLMVFGPSPSIGVSITEAAMQTYWLQRLRRGPTSIANGSRAAFRYLFTESPKL